MEQDRDWAQWLVAEVGKRVARFREQTTDAKGRKMSAQALAERCAELGLPIGRVAIAKLETGAREKISLPELLVIAHALGVPPVLLVCPIGDGKDIEILPGHHVSPWDAARWISGLASLDGAADDSGVIALFHRHAELVTSYREITPMMTDRYGADGGAVMSGAAPTTGPVAMAAMEMRLGLARDLRRVRSDIRKLGLTPPDLPPDLDHASDGA